MCCFRTGKPRETWGHKATDPEIHADQFQDSRVGEETVPPKVYYYGGLFFYFWRRKDVFSERMNLIN
jgi:hypothetical protein